MLNRRKLFGLAAATPAVAFGVNASRASPSDAPNTELMRLTQGDPKVMMHLIARPPKEKPAEVGLAIGKDGKLWLKSNGEWKRIVTE